MRARRRFMAVTLIGAMVLGLGILPSTAAVLAEACPAGAVPATRFADTVTSNHRASIDCAAWWGLTRGTSATRFGAQDPVTRGQTAALVARLLHRTGDAPSDVPAGGFDDTRGHRFEADIDLLAHLDIVRGTSATRFQPDLPISRAQMASIVARMFERGYDAPLAPGDVPFDDVPESNTHHDAIGALVGAAITTGVTARSYAPHRAISRAEMVTFLMRSVRLLVTGGRATPPSGAAPADAYNGKIRATWVHLFDDTIKTKAGIVAMLEELVAADVNLVIAQVIRRQDAYYVSDVLPRTPDPRVAPDFDVLDTLLTEAHKRGIKVHAWYSVAPTWHDVYQGLPAPEGWIPKTHAKTVPEPERWISRTYDGEWSGYLDPGVPAVQDHVAAVVGEIAERYPVDGIHLDYTRYQSEEYGYNPIALAQYRTETGATGTPKPTDPKWSDWRRAQTRRIVQRARKAIDASGRDVALSAAVITWGSGPPTPDRAGFQRTLAYTRTMQDWDWWIRSGDVDMVMPMNYFRQHDADGARWFSQWLAHESRLAADSASKVVPGPAGYLNYPNNGLAQIARAMAGADGAAVYSFQQPTIDHSRGIWKQLGTSRWRYAPMR